MTVYNGILTKKEPRKEKEEEKKTVKKRREERKYGEIGNRRIDRVDSRSSRKERNLSLVTNGFGSFARPFASIERFLSVSFFLFFFLLFRRW